MKILQSKLFLVFFLIFFQLPVFSELLSDAQEELLMQLPPDQRASIESKMEDTNRIEDELDEIFEADSFLVERPDDDKKIISCEECIFGYEIFKYSPSTFAPANIVPVSSTYALGPGDKLTIDLYGSKQDSEKVTVSRDGTIYLPFMGRMNVAGLTFFEAQRAIDKRAKTELIGTEVSISLDELRSITVYVLGEAYQPGAYTLSALSTVTNTLFLSGGVNKQGSLRNIQIKRGGETIKEYDFYDMLVYGDTSKDFRLEDGDTVFIPFFETTVQAGGSFKRPHLYEVLEGENLEDVITLAGGFKNEVSINPQIEYTTINRKTNQRDTSIIAYNDETKGSLVSNGDTINVSENSELEALFVELTGQFKKPGTYTFKQGDTIIDVVKRAGGYTKSSFTEGGVLLRKKVAEQEKEAYETTADNLESILIDLVKDSNTPVTEFTIAPITKLVDTLRTAEPLGRVVTSFDLLELRTDPYSNIEIQSGDKIHIPKRPNSISVIGEVLKSTSLQYHPQYELTDYLESAGGFNRNADEKRVYVISPNGQAKLYKQKFFRQSFDIVPGSTIFVPREARDTLSYSRIITPIFADLALAAAALTSINN
jgi:protein involved in polysaccharide export with SLBB domain